VVTSQCDLGTDGYGCVLTVDVETPEPFVERDLPAVGRSA
jgi:hypothetical protein